MHNAQTVRLTTNGKVIQILKEANGGDQAKGKSYAESKFSLLLNLSKVLKMSMLTRHSGLNLFQRYQ